MAKQPGAEATPDHASGDHAAATPAKPAATPGASLLVLDCERCGLPILGGPASFRLDVPMTGSQTLLLCADCLVSVQKWVRAAQTRHVVTDEPGHAAEPAGAEGEAHAPPKIPYAGEREGSDGRGRRSRRRSNRREMSEFNQRELGRESMAILTTLGWTLGLMGLCILLMILFGFAQSY